MGRRRFVLFVFALTFVVLTFVALAFAEEVTAPAAATTDAAPRITGVPMLQVRVLDVGGVELPREATMQFRYALALVPGALFGVADRTTLRQMNPDKTRIALDTDALTQWAAKGARAWRPTADGALTIAPTSVRVARVMSAAFTPQGDSHLGVGFHDLTTDNNLILMYVDAPCAITGTTGPPEHRVVVDLRFGAAGLYWLRSAPSQTIIGFPPRSPTLDVRTRN